MKLLATIASYGTENDTYLEQVIEEYRSMSHDVDVVVLSDIPRKASLGVEVVVGLPTSDPWSLPFAHKGVLADRVDRYDLFIYSENDILITEKNINSFLWATTLLPENEIAGFLRTELDPIGHRYYPDMNKMYHWDPRSVVRRGSHIFACFTCEHAGCYMLTRQQLRRAIDSGGFLIEPHEGQYDLAETAATDPYTQCGFRKMICITELDNFFVPHLSNKYIGSEYDLPESDFNRQLRALLEIGEGARSTSELLERHTHLTRHRWFKNYYEPWRPEVGKLIPAEVKSLLSVGCGWGATEERLAQRGVQVVGVPLDSVISACAEARGVRTVSPNFTTAWTELEHLHFDCVLVSNILHLTPDAAGILKQCGRLLSDGGCIVLIVPNFNYLKILWKRICRTPEYRNMGNYDDTGMNLTTYRLIREWLRRSGLVMDRAFDLVPERAEALPKIVGQYRAAELIVSCRKKIINDGQAIRCQTEIRHHPEAQLRVAE
jgi:2-polyprenyl-3-methyl-5-hydroxy-6-metoxy-1,4-benzoquinol methylase